jgi:RNA polymerase subunit RPABC4/transcription elongation factor Spt4
LPLVAPGILLRAVIRNLILAGAALVIVFWIGLAYWVNKDARQRIRNWFPILLATALGLVPFVGPLVYLLLRPGETRAEIRTRNVEIAAFEAQIDRNRPACPECSAAVESDYLVCPVCTTRLHHPCVHCNAPLEPLWQTCPYCATPIEADVDLDMALTREARAVAASDRTAKRAKV